MKNDYKRKDFKLIKINNINHYYIRVDNKYIEVSNNIYKVLRNDYMKLHRDIDRDFRNIIHIDSELIINSFEYYDPINSLYIKENKRVINDVLDLLDEEEKYIIFNLYFFEMTEKELSDVLGISQQLVNYKKKKILKKMKILLLKQNSSCF